MANNAYLNTAYSLGQGPLTPMAPFPIVANRVPTTSDKNYPIGQEWVVHNQNLVYFLASVVSNSATWVQITGGVGILTITGDNAIAVPPLAGNINLIGGTGITVDATGPHTLTVSTSGSQNYTVTQVTFADSPYTVLPTDEYLSVDSTGGAVIINLPDAPATGKTFYIKDAAGQSQIGGKSITIKSLTGAATVDLGASYIENSVQFESAGVLFNGNTSNYELF